MKYQLKTEDMTGNGYVVVSSDGLQSILDYGRQYTRNRPLAHLRLYVEGRDVAVAINGEYYVRVADSALLTTIAELDDAEQGFEERLAKAKEGGR